MILNSEETLREVVNNIMMDMFFIFPDMDDEGLPVEKTEATKDFTDVSIHYNSEYMLYFRIEHDILSEMAANFLGLGPDEIDIENLQATASETANIIGGNHLVEADPEQKYTLSIPQVMDASNAIPKEDRPWSVSFCSEDSAIIVWPQKRKL